MSGNKTFAQKLRTFGIPNWLSILRLILIPVFIVVYFSEIYIGGVDRSGIIAAAVLVFSGLTDVCDGIIARKYNMITATGKVLDPLADKLTQATICVCLVIMHVELSWILGILVAKELIMIIVGADFIRKGKELMSSKWFGKLGTVLFYAVTILIIAELIPMNVALIMLCVVLASMLFSFAMYIPYFFKMKAAKDKH